MIFVEPDWIRARRLVGKQWLRDGVELRTFIYSEYGNYLSEIRRYPPLAWKFLIVVGWAAMKLLFPLLFLTRNDPCSSELQRFEGAPPAAIAFGDGPQCKAAEILRLGPRKRGVWVLTSERFAYGAFAKRNPIEALRSLKTGNVSAAKLKVHIDVPANRFRFDGSVTRHIAHQEATYFRITFIDGSGVDVLCSQRLRLPVSDLVPARNP